MIPAVHANKMSKKSGLREQVRNWSCWSVLAFACGLGAVQIMFNLIVSPFGLLQNLKTLDPSKLTPLTPEVISRQATINIGRLIVKPSYSLLVNEHLLLFHTRPCSSNQAHTEQPPYVISIASHMNVCVFCLQEPSVMSHTESPLL